MEVAGPLGTPLGLAQRKRASPRGEAGTSGFLCVSDSDRGVPAELGLAGRGTIEATPKELSETRSGRCREPWRRNLLVPLVRLKAREGRGHADRADGGEPIGSWFAGAEQE